MEYEVVIAAYNAVDHISETIQSFLESSVKPKRIWVVDDASSDETATIADSFEKVSVLKNETNMERSVSRNRGIAHCSAPYIQIIDADDLVAHDKVERQLHYLQAHSNVNAVFGDKIIFDDDADITEKRAMSYEDVDDLLEEIIRLNTIVPGMLLFRRSFFETYGTFDESIVIAEDRELLIRSLMEGAKIHYTPGAAMYYRRHQGSSVVTQYAKGIWNNVLMFRKLFDALITYQNGRYKQATVNAVRTMARNLNMYRFPMSEVFKEIDRAHSTDETPQMDQSNIYNVLQRLLGDKALELLLRPKFVLDQLFNR